MQTLKKLIFSVLFTLSLLFSITNPLYAANYGDGNYGDDLYNSGGTSTSSPSSSQSSISSSIGPKVCTDTAPTEAPWLYGAVTKSSDSILLYFTQVKINATNYVLEYGTKSGSYQYSSVNIAGNNTSTYLVQMLAPGTKYYFHVRASNGCATGSWSNELSGETFSIDLTNHLDIVSSQLTPQTLTPNSNSTNNTLKPNASGYNLNVYVKDTNGNPVADADVTIHSDPITTKTNTSGLAKFTNVPAGEHKVLISYNNFQGEQSVNLTGDVKEFNLNITVKPVSVFQTKEFIITVSVFVILILILVFLLFRRRR